MPVFAPGDDPGSNFPELLRRLGADVTLPTGDVGSAGAVPHATTCVAVRIAGDGG